MLHPLCVCIISVYISRPLFCAALTTPEPCVCSYVRLIQNIQPSLPRNLIEIPPLSRIPNASIGLSGNQINISRLKLTIGTQLTLPAYPYTSPTPPGSRHVATHPTGTYHTRKIHR
ncbi:hypothetical protein M434DRAFT_170495 [Hypoxylon sp. CO27-5]|nr:hypothetical protein M434DRAFT_170495 [Hypoxylon sp. CO27-5]